ncbi:MAG: ArsR/SmtB family transcription factor [Thermomicrobiales bacterium]
MTDHGKILTVDASVDSEQTLTALKALASDWRLRILRLLGTESASVNQIAAALGVPAVTAAMHVKALEDAQLIHARLVPASRGLQKVCSRTYDQIKIILPSLEQAGARMVEIAMPIGAYVDVDVTPTCGMATETALIGIIDDPTCFLEPERINAQILWFRHGYVEYRFPYRVPPGARATGVQVRMEVCSEAPTHNEECPSDITLWINGVEVGSWTSPSDFGGSRGALTPSWWLDTDSQFGLQKRWEVNHVGTFVDGVQISDASLEDLSLDASKAVTVRLGVKPDARHVNGLNLFGRAFGNYPEDLILRIAYDHEGR